MAILLFNLTFAADMKHLYLCEARVPCDPDGNECDLNDQLAKLEDKNKTVV